MFQRQTSLYKHQVEENTWNCMWNTTDTHQKVWWMFIWQSVAISVGQTAGSGAKNSWANISYEWVESCPYKGMEVKLALFMRGVHLNQFYHCMKVIYCYFLVCVWKAKFHSVISFFQYRVFLFLATFQHEAMLLTFLYISPLYIYVFIISLASSELFHLQNQNYTWE